jgi:hypothetical protein
MAFSIIVIVSLIFLYAGQNEVNLKPAFHYDQMSATSFIYFFDSCLQKH